MDVERCRSLVEGLDVPVRHLVVLADREIPAYVDDLAICFPQTTVSLLLRPKAIAADDVAHPGNVSVHACKTLTDLREVLRILPRPQVVIESRASRTEQTWADRLPRAFRTRSAAHESKERRVSWLRHLFWFVAPGGIYVVDDEKSPVDPDTQETARGLCERVAHLRGQSPAERAGLADWEDDLVRSSVEVAGVPDGAAALGKRFRHRLKVREHEVEEVLDARYPEARPYDVLERRPAEVFESRARLTSYGEGPALAPSSYEVPELSVRRYRQVVCHPLQVVRRGDFWLPDSFRHPLDKVLVNRNLVAGDPQLSRVAPRANRSQRKVEGEFYYFDSELPYHFGHLTTEVLSRFWGWHSAVRDNPAIRPLISLRKGADEMPGFLRQMFLAFGIPADTVEYIRFGEAVQVESLVSATPQFVNPRYVAPGLAATWQQVSDGLADDTDVELPDRFFVSRRITKRWCHETAQVEQFFADRGFDIVFPEDLSYPHQVRMFAHARVIAGFGGSGMFNMMFSPQARIILVSSNNYTAFNEGLFASVNGNDVSYFWGEADIPDSADEPKTVRFQSDWHVDLARHRSALETTIDG